MFGKRENLSKHKNSITRKRTHEYRLVSVENTEREVDNISKFPSRGLQYDTSEEKVKKFMCGGSGEKQDKKT